MDTNTQFQLILDEIKKLSDRVSKLELPQESQVVTQEIKLKTVSIKEFLLEIKPTDDVQRTLSIAFYLENQEGYTSFNKVDIEKGFRAAKEKVPSNINDKIGMCVKNGHMMEAEEKKDSLKAWTITSTGEKVLQVGFSRLSNK